jgi:hypothetical protein
VAIDLPDVVQKWSADLADYLGPLEAAIAMTEDLAKAANEATLAVGAVQGALDALHGRDISVAVDVAGTGLPDLAAAIAGLGDHMDQLTVHADNMDAALANIRETSAATADAMALLGDRADNAGQSVVRLGGGWLGWLGALRGTQVALFGGVLPGILGAVGGFHLLADAVLETIAVVGPAAIAFGAFAAAAAPVVGDITTQMKNLYTVTTATGQSIYPLTGAFQRMSDAVQPEVYQLFGQALSVANSKTGEFTDLATGAGQVLDVLGARMEVALTSGGGFNAFLSNAVSDLAKLGDIAGNVLGSLGNLFHAVPGYAQILLNLVDAGSRVIEWATRVGEPVIAAGMAIHGAFIYAGLGVTALARIIPGALSGISGWAEKAAYAASSTRILGPAGEAAGAGLMSVATGAETAAALPWGWILTAAAGIGVLVYALASARDATQAWLDSMQGALQAASGIKGVSMLMADQVQVANRLAFAQEGLAEAQRHVVITGVAVGHGYGVISNNVQPYQNQVRELTSGQRILADQGQLLADRLATLGGQYRNTTVANQALTHSGTSLATVLRNNAGAMGLITAAGVPMNLLLNKSSEAWAEVRSMVEATARAYLAMGQTGGRLGADMTVLNTLSSDQYRAMSSLNQAWDQYMSAATSGMQAALGAAQGFKTLTKEGQNVHASFTGVNNASLQMRGTFEQQITSTQGVIDSMRLAGASTKDMGMVVSTFLEPALKNGAVDFSGYRDQIYAAAKEAGYAGPNAVAPLSQYLRDNAGSLAGATDKASRYAGMNVTLKGAVSTLTTAVDALIKTLGGVPPGVTTKFNTPGLSASQAAADAYTQALLSIPQNITTTITQVFTSHGHQGGMQWGGVVASSGVHMVGEQGPELRWLNAGDYISTASETRQILSAGGSAAVHASSGAGAGGPAAALGEAVIHVHVHQDGQEMWQVQQRHTLIYNRRNGNQFAGAVAPPRP